MVVDASDCLEWLFWQVGNLGPMAGQLSHFVNYAQGEHPYSHKRYADEYNRCVGILERRLDGREFILDDYSIADMASWPWVLIAKPLGQPLDEFPNVTRWRETIKERQAVQRGVDLGRELRRSAPPIEEERRILLTKPRGGPEAPTSLASSGSGASRRRAAPMAGRCRRRSHFRA